MAELRITPAVINITMPMAVTNSINYTFKHRDGTPIDITTATLYFTVKDVALDTNAGDTTAKIKKELTITDGVNGKANLFLTQQETFLTVGEYYYDVKIVQLYNQSNTTVDVALMGLLTITSDSTNRVVGIT